MRLRPRFVIDSYARLRRRMLRETEAALLHGLEHPELAPRIPTIEVGHGGFERTFAERYWEERLGLNEPDQESRRGFSLFQLLGSKEPPSARP